MRPRWTDLGVPALIATIAVVEVLGYDGPGRFTALGFELAGCLLLVLRRRSPLAICSAAALVTMTTWYAGPAVQDLATPIFVFVAAAYALGRWIADLRGLVGMGVIVAGTVAAYLLVDTRSHDITDVVFISAFLVPPYVFGRIARRLSTYNALLHRERELVRREAVRDERDRIAREVHDVIAHSVSAMVVQVAAAQDLVRQRPEQAEAVLARVAETGRRAIAETGRLLHVLRDTDNELGLAPTPGLADLDALAGEFRADGLVVELVVDGLPVEMPAAVSVSAYRIVRECLTNALRYAPDRAVRVEVLGTPSGLTIRSANRTDGRTGLGSGLGLAGLAERVDLLGGSLRHGPADGQWQLVATLPLERELV